MKKRPQIETHCELMLDGFKELAREIEAQGIDADTASHYAALIGDRPVTDEHGNILVIGGEQVIATLKPLQFFALDDDESNVIDGDAVQPDYAAIAQLSPEQFERLQAAGRLDHEADQVRHELTAAYVSRFGSLPAALRPEIKFERGFDELLRLAIRRGFPVTDVEFETITVVNSFGPIIPAWVPAERQRFATLRAVPPTPGRKADYFAFMTDTGEWAVECEAAAETIRAAFPAAKVVMGQS